MNRYIEILSAIAFLSMSFFPACTLKDTQTVFKIAETEYYFINELPNDAQLISWSPEEKLKKNKAGIIVKCPSPQCESLVLDLLSYFQNAVNESCKPVKLAIQCCSGSYSRYAVLKIIPIHACHSNGPITHENQIS